LRRLGPALDPSLPPPPPPSLRQRLALPLGLLLSALAVASLEVGYHKYVGGDLMLGPIRPFWIAAPLALVGVGFTLWRLMEDQSDE
jgi:hypothetical protein